MDRVVYFMYRYALTNYMGEDRSLASAYTLIDENSKNVVVLWNPFVHVRDVNKFLEEYLI